MRYCSIRRRCRIGLRLPEERRVGSAATGAGFAARVFDTTAVQDVDTLAVYQVNPQKKFSWHAGEIALAARASYRTMNGALMLAPVGARNLRGG